ncbi:uncharacterized protein AB9W97_019314 isoform 2-T2 [Spinachia spinachia]
MVEDAVKKALGMEDKDKDEDKSGIFSKIFNRDSDDDKKKKREEDEDDKKEGFFSKIFDRDGDEDKKKESKSGFSGLFSEMEGATSAGGHDGDHMGGGVTPQTVQINDGDLFNDLMNVADEMKGDPDL